MPAPHISPVTRGPRTVKLFGRRSTPLIALGVLILIGVVVALLLPSWQQPDRVVWRNPTAARAAEQRASVYRLSDEDVTVGRISDIRTVTGVRSNVVLTIEHVAAEAEDGRPEWVAVASEETTETATLNGQPLTASEPLTDGDVLIVGPYELRFEVGPTGWAAFYDWWEASTITHQFLSPSMARRSFPIVARAFPVSVLIVLVAFAIAIPLGLTLAFMKMAKLAILRWIATIYVDVVRGTPLFLQILLVFFGIPLLPMWKTLTQAIPWMNSAGLFGITNTLYVRAFLVLSLNSAAYMCEIFRAGIQSIPKGQTEAARSLGMTTPQAMTFVIIPQTVRRILPTLMSEFILLFKDTALLAAVGLAEMALRAKEISASTFNTTPFVLAAFFYLVVTIPLGRIVQRLENKLAESEGGGPRTFDKSKEDNLAAATLPAPALQDRG